MKNYLFLVLMLLFFNSQAKRFLPKFLETCIYEVLVRAPKFSHKTLGRIYSKSPKFREFMERNMLKEGSKYIPFDKPLRATIYEGTLYAVVILGVAGMLDKNKAETKKGDIK